MALQLSQYPYLNIENHAVGQIGPGFAWHIDKNVAEPVALAMLPALTGLIAQRGLLLLVCDASISASNIKAFAAATAAQATLRNYYYKLDLSNTNHMLFQAMLEGIREANTAVAHHYWPNAGQVGDVALTDNLAGISMTAVVAHPDKLVIGSVGNTRAYRMRRGRLASYEQSGPEQLIVLEDDLRKDDRIFVCTQSLAHANDIGRIRTALRPSKRRPEGNSNTDSAPAAMRSLVEAATQADAMEVAAAAILYRTASRGALKGGLGGGVSKPTNGPAGRPTGAPIMLPPRQGLVLAPPRTLVPHEPPVPLPPVPTATPTPRTGWISVISIVLALLTVGWLAFESQRDRLAITLRSLTQSAVASSATPAATATPLPVATSLMAVPVLDSNADAPVSGTGNISVVITTSEAGIVVFKLAETATPVAPPTPVPSLTPPPTPTPEPSPTALPQPTVTSTQPVARATAAPPRPTRPAPPPQPTSPPPQPTSPPPQPTSPPPQPTSPPPQPTSPPPQPTSPPPQPPQPTSPPPQPTSPPPQPTSPPPQPTTPPPPPEPSVPCLPGDTQCKP